MKLWNAVFTQLFWYPKTNVKACSPQFIGIAVLFIGIVYIFTASKKLFFNPLPLVLPALYTTLVLHLIDTNTSGVLDVYALPES